MFQCYQPFSLGSMTLKWASFCTGLLQHYQLRLVRAISLSCSAEPSNIRISTTQVEVTVSPQGDLGKTKALSTEMDINSEVRTGLLSSEVRGLLTVSLGLKSLLSAQHFKLVVVFMLLSWILIGREKGGVMPCFFLSFFSLVQLLLPSHPLFSPWDRRNTECVCCELHNFGTVAYLC
jgi:hypothetical protein